VKRIWEIQDYRFKGLLRKAEKRAIIIQGFPQPLVHKLRPEETPNGSVEQGQLISEMMEEILAIQVLVSHTDKLKTISTSVGKIPGSRLVSFNKQPGSCHWQQQATVSVGKSA
jgi:hypothetical protein